MCIVQATAHKIIGTLKIMPAAVSAHRVHQIERIGPGNLLGQIGILTILSNFELNDGRWINRLALCRITFSQPGTDSPDQEDFYLPGLKKGKKEGEEEKEESQRERGGKDVPFSFPPATRARSGCWRTINSKSELLVDNMVSGRAE